MYSSTLSLNQILSFNLSAEEEWSYSEEEERVSVSVYREEEREEEEAEITEYEGKWQKCVRDDCWRANDSYPKGATDFI